MPKNKKTLCDWRKKDIQENFTELIEMVREPRFVCMKCGRAANSEKVLCKANEV